MIDSEKIKNHLVGLGLKSEDVNNLSIENAILYLRFCYEKQRKSQTHLADFSISFANFSIEETLNLITVANKCNLDVQSRISDNLTFFCASENVELDVIERVGKYKTIILTKKDFKSFFVNEKLDFLYDKSVLSEYQIAKPLSNFDIDKTVKSMSFDSDDKYSINIYSMTCTCLDFNKQNRKDYSKGDLRRMCKHLRAEYINSFGLHWLSPFKKSIILYAPHFRRNFKLISIEDFQNPVIILYNTDNEWWEIFVPNKSGEFKEYSYSSTGDRFAYDDKPHGIVRLLKAKFKEIRNELNSSSTPKIYLEDALKDFHVFMRNTIVEASKNHTVGHQVKTTTALNRKINAEANRLEKKYKNEFGEAKVHSQIQNIIFQAMTPNIQTNDSKPHPHGCSAFVFVFVILFIVFIFLLMR